MRRILLHVFNYDSVNGEEWSYDQEALIIAPDIVLTVSGSLIEFSYYDKPIGDDVKVLDWRSASFSEIEVVRADVLGGMMLEEIAAMSLADLAGLLRKYK